MPDPEWKNQLFTDPIERESRQNEWYLGDTYHVAIGQGYLLTTPLQVNAWTNVIANGGKLCKPTIGKVTRDRRQGTSSCKDLGIQPQTIALVSEGMRRACEPGGTGWPLFNFNIKYQKSLRAGPEANIINEGKEASDSSELVTKRIPVACKTGTAEFGDPNERTHAWITVFAPIPKEFVPDSGNQDIKSDQIDAQGPTLSEDDVLTGEPEISVTVLVEGGGEGSYVAAPIAKSILEEWFSR
jgi:penicillin-binding protein 2